MHIVEVATESANERFDALKKYDDLFSFLYDFKNFENNKESGKLYNSCMKLERELTHGENMDIDGSDLCREFPLIATSIF